MQYSPRRATVTRCARDRRARQCQPGKAEVWLLEQANCLDEAAIESCLSIGMVRGEDGSLAFRHELARRAFETRYRKPGSKSACAGAIDSMQSDPVLHWPAWPTR